MELSLLLQLSILVSAGKGEQHHILRRMGRKVSRVSGLIRTSELEKVGQKNALIAERVFFLCIYFTGWWAGFVQQANHPGLPVRDGVYRG
jgi:hypothetical protein